MEIGIVGSGVVGQALGTALATGGHDVVLGTRDPTRRDDRKGRGMSLREWADACGGRVATFKDAAAHGTVVINATAGTVSVQALGACGSALDGKILIDVSNPLDFSQGFPPSLSVCNTDSAAEQIQRAIPAAHVVKALNTVTAALMVHPSAVAGGDHTLPICGNDGSAKQRVTGWLGSWFGWKPEAIVDLGDLTAARAQEMWLPLWLRLMQAQGTPMFNMKVVK